MATLQLSGLPRDSDDELLEARHAQESPGWLRRNRCTLITGAGLLLIAGFVAVGIVFLDTARSDRFPVPKRFSADFVVVSKFNTTKTWSGGVHKVVDDDDNWVLSGQAAVVSHGGAQKETVTFVGGKAYTVTEHPDTGAVVGRSCEDTGAIPQVMGVQTGLRDAVSLTHVALDDSRVSACADQPKWLVTYDGLTYVVCYFPEQRRAQLISESLDITLFNINTNPAEESPYTVPVDAAGQPVTCSASRRLGGCGDGGGGCEVSFPSCNMELARRRLRPQAPAKRDLLVSNPGSLTWYLDSRYGPSGVNCVFVHGAGVNTGVGWSSSFKEYWGDIDVQLRMMGRCENIKFVRANTLDRWDSGGPASAFCNAAVNAHTGKVHDTIIFAHGMGNLIVANALMTGRCSLDAATTRWVEIQPISPMGRVTDWARMICNAWASLSTNIVVQALNLDLNMCETVGVAVPKAYDSYLSMDFNDPAITESVASFIKKNVDAASCASYPRGLAGSSYLYILSEPYNSITYENPKLMWSTCWDSDYSSRLFPDSTSRYYLGTFNYLDGTCRNGDGAYGVDRQPCQFIINMSHQFVSTSGDIV